MKNTLRNLISVIFNGLKDFFVIMAKHHIIFVLFLISWVIIIDFIYCSNVLPEHNIPEFFSLLDMSKWYLPSAPLTFICIIINIFIFIFLLNEFSKRRINTSEYISILGSIMAISALSAFCWRITSYNVFYDGTHSGFSEVKKISADICKYILNSDIDEIEKKRKIKSIFEKRKAGYEILKNNVLWASKPSNRDEKGEKDHYILDEKLRKIVYIKNKQDMYSFIFKYHNRPYWWIGIGRAFTLSLDTLKPLLEKKSKTCNIFCKIQELNSVYFNEYIYQRSKHFWTPFGLSCIALLIFWICYISKEYELLKIGNESQKKDAVYEIMRRDFSIKVNDTRNNLQGVQSDWDKMVKVTKEYMMPNIRLTRHDLKNCMNALGYVSSHEDYNQSDTDDISMRDINEYLQKYYEVSLRPAIDAITEKLYKFEKILDLQPILVSVSDLITLFKDPERQNTIPHMNQSKVLFDEDIKQLEMNVNKNYKVRVIQIQSIILNLLENSLGATKRKSDEIRHKQGRSAEKLYQRKIWLKVSINEQFFHIEVQDNGGGFPNDIIDKIYKVFIPSTKQDDKRPHGEATMYIGDFIEKMDGKITAENVKENEETCALTTIDIPVITNK